MSAIQIVRNHAVITLGGEIMRPDQAASSLPFDELLALGLCECGVFFDEHPPIRKRGVAPSWHSERSSDQPWRNTITGKVMTPAAMRWAGVHDPNARAGMVRVCKGCGCDMPTDRPKRSLYHSAECYQRNRGRGRAFTITGIPA